MTQWCKRGRKHVSEKNSDSTCYVGGAYGVRSIKRILAVDEVADLNLQPTNKKSLKDLTSGPKFFFLMLIMYQNA